MKEYEKYRESIWRIFTSAAIGVSLVSFYTTAQGLKGYVFDHYWQAYLVSSAIQFVLFTLNLKLLEFVKKLSYKVVLPLWFIALILSSSFSYIYIVNVIYHTDLYYNDSDRILDEECSEKCYTYEDDIKEYQAYVKKSIDIYSSIEYKNNDNYNMEEKLKTDIQGMIDLAQNAIPDYESSQEKILFEGLIRKAEEFSSNYIQEDIDSFCKTIVSTRDAIINTKGNIGLKITDKEEEWKGVNERLSQYRDYKEIEFQNVQQQNNQVSDEKDSLRKYIQALDNIIPIIAEYNTKAKDILENNPEYKIWSLKGKIRGEISKEKSDISIHKLENYTNEIVEVLIQQGIKAESNEIKDCLNFKQSVKIYGELSNSRQRLEKVIKEMDSYRKSNKNNETKEYDDDTIKDWKSEWQNRLNQLRSIIRDMPLLEDVPISGKNKLKEQSITMPVRAEEVLDISKMERNYMEDLSDIEKAGLLLFSRYNKMAWYSLIFAIVLDGFGALAGIFLHKLEKKEEKKRKKQEKKMSKEGKNI